MTFHSFVIVGCASRVSPRRLDSAGLSAFAIRESRTPRAAVAHISRRGLARCRHGCHPTPVAPPRSPHHRPPNRAGDWHATCSFYFLSPSHARQGSLENLTWKSKRPNDYLPLAALHCTPLSFRITPYYIRHLRLDFYFSVWYHLTL